MANKIYSLKDRLEMQRTQQMQVGTIYNIMSVDRIVEFTDKKTGEIRKAVVVLCDDGAMYYLPNTIANAYLQEVAENGEEVTKALFEGHSFRCEEFTAKRYGTKGKTIHQIS